MGRNLMHAHHISVKSNLILIGPSQRLQSGPINKTPNGQDELLGDGRMLINYPTIELIEKDVYTRAKEAF
jgi:hypothetical protein